MTVHMFSLMKPSDLKKAFEDGLVKVQTSDDGQFIYNYTDRALYTHGAWDNPAVRICRGLIVRPNGEVAARPWAKFFNVGQQEAGDLDLDARCEVTDKLDGSLGIIHFDENWKLRVATRGSFTSEQAIRATQMLHERDHSLVMGDLSEITLLVEIIYPENRIVCDYGGREELVLLGGVVVDTGQYLGPYETAQAVGWGGPITAELGYDTIREALAAEPRPGAEGMCIRIFGENRIVKLKQEDYVRLHRIVTGLSERSVWEHMSQGEPVESLLDELPDELHGWTTNVWFELKMQADSIEDAAEMAHERILERLNAGFERRDYAFEAQKRAHLRPYLFMLLDGRDPRPAILKSLKPAGNTHAKTISEAVA